MATRREVMGGLVALMLSLTGTQALAQAPASSKSPPANNLSSSVGLAVYPSKGQGAPQQQQDETECFSWAQQQTGLNPLGQAMVTASAPASTQGPPPGTEAARGAVAGAAIGILTGRPMRGAAVGATGGAMVGAAREQGREEQANAQAQAQAQQAQQLLATFNRSFGACLGGRGYSVK
jgi:Protein of unknown function (DUF1269)